MLTSPNRLGAIETSKISCRNTAALALTIVRDGVITGEGPTTRGRVHFSRALDAHDAAWCARILTATAVEHQPVSRAEAEALFEINDAAAERSDDGRFDDLLAKAVVHHAASASGLPVPPRTVALSPDTAIESWAPTHGVVDIEVLEWIASQMRGKPPQQPYLGDPGRDPCRGRRAAAGAPAERVRHRDVISSPITGTTGGDTFAGLGDYPVVFGVRTNEFDERNAAGEIESNDRAGRRLDDFAVLGSSIWKFIPFETMKIMPRRSEK